MVEAAVQLTDVRVTSRGLRAARLNTGGEGADSVILDGVSLEVAAGATLSVLGESGGGKSTLFRTINRLIDADAGNVNVLGKGVREWDIRGLRRTAVYVAQRSYLFGGTVREELYLPQKWNGQPTLKLAVADVMQAVQLKVELERPSKELSEGQRHRLNIARAMLLRPKLLLLDEPTGALDVRTAREMLGEIKRWVENEGITLMCITHRPEDLEVLGGDALILLGGKVAGRYPAADVAAGKVDADVSAFLGSPS
ncbi:MAG: ATP-binding cassette domain-containing protein [Planctomycetes bacterium]|nr:ATP-binding cassette domain-containing protein [Planctomycetota bacterium]